MMKNRNKHSYYLKFWIIIVLIVIFFFCPTFAADKCDWTVADSLQKINVFFWNAWRFCSWIWILLWNYAWVLMTNTMVYWEFMWLDVFLWKIRQVCRSMANYALGFMFIYSIFKYLLSQKWDSPIKNLKNLLISSVLIQASWFLVMALVDLSTIALATVSAFPSQVMSVSTEIEKNAKAQICKSSVLGQENKKVIVINAFSDEAMKQSNNRWFTTENPSSPSWGEECPSLSLLDSLLPQANNLWWPFVYLGFTALNAQDYVYWTMPTASNCTDNIVKTVINLLLWAWILLLYTIALSLLIIILIMRLWYLWVFIAISPIVVLVSFSWLFNISKLRWKLGELFDYKKALFLIFQPVIFWLWMSLMFLVVVVFQWLFSNSPESYVWQWVSVNERVNSSSRTDAIPKITSTLETSWIIEFSVKQWAKSLKDILLSFVILILMWQLVKLAVGWKFMWFSGISSISSKVGGIAESIWNTFGSVWVIPLPGWKKMWLSAISEWSLYSGLKAKSARYFQSRDKSNDTIDKIFWLDSWKIIVPLTDTQKENLGYLVTGSHTPSAFVEELWKVKEENKWLKYNDALKELINKWILEHRSDDPEIKDKMIWYFGKDLWSELQTADPLDIDKYIGNVKYQEWFRKFYKEVLKWEDYKDITYHDFINKNKWEVS